MVTRTEFESGHTCPTHSPTKMLATNLRFGADNSDMSESDSFFAEKEPEVWKKTAVPKFEDLRVARSMKVLLSRGQENTDPYAAASAGSKSTPASAGTKRRKSYVCQNKPLVFKVNPLYEPPVPAASEDEEDKETVASPSKKRNVLPVKSPHTKEKEMVSAILQLAAYGEQHYKKKDKATKSQGMIAKLTGRQKQKGKVHRKLRRSSCMDRIQDIP